MTQTTSKTGTRKRKIDKTRVLKLADANMSAADIAKVEGVNRSTITRFLNTEHPDYDALEAFRARKAEIMNALQGKSAEVVLTILEDFTPEVLHKMTIPEKKEILRIVSTSFGIASDKIRQLQQDEGREGGITIQVVVPEGPAHDTKPTEQPAEDQPTQDAPTVQVEV